MNARGGVVVVVSVAVDPRWTLGTTRAALHHHHTRTAKHTTAMRNI